MRRLIVTFGAIALLSCGRDPAVSRLRVHPAQLQIGSGQCGSLDLEWLPLLPLRRRDGNPTVFVHLRDGRDRVVRTFDHPLPHPWSPNRRQRYSVDLCLSVIGDPLPAGRYTIKLGLYDDSLGYRWPLEVRGDDPKSRQYLVATVDVPPAEARERIRFLSGWQAAEPGKDRQVVARRRLSGPEGSLLVTSGDGRKLRLELAVFGASARISTVCNGRTLSVEPGRQVVALPLAETPCEIRLSAPGGASLENAALQ